jgi:hypothetical protein
MGKILRIPENFSTKNQTNLPMKYRLHSQTKTTNQSIYSMKCIKKTIKIKDKLSGKPIYFNR